MGLQRLEAGSTSIAVPSVWICLPLVGIASTSAGSRIRLRRPRMRLPRPGRNQELMPFPNLPSFLPSLPRSEEARYPLCWSLSSGWANPGSWLWWLSHWDTLLLPWPFLNLRDALGHPQPFILRHWLPLLAWSIWSLLTRSLAYHSRLAAYSGSPGPLAPDGCRDLPGVGGVAGVYHGLSIPLQPL